MYRAIRLQVVKLSVIGYAIPDAGYRNLSCRFFLQSQLHPLDAVDQFLRTDPAAQAIDHDRKGQWRELSRIYDYQIRMGQSAQAAIQSPVFKLPFQNLLR
jgi:hypothetical protein